MITMEQQRAKNAWACAKDQGKDYVNLVKGLPALLMNSGLMQVMAFLNEKGRKTSQRHCEDLAGHLRVWLHERHGVPADFKGFMEALMNAEPRKFQAITEEAFAWLKWARQMAAARVEED